MFDCVWPTRTAVCLALRLRDFAINILFPLSLTSLQIQRFGNAITAQGVLKLRNAQYAEDFEPMEASCTCICCRPWDQGGLAISRAYIYHIASKETVGAHL